MVLYIIMIGTILCNKSLSIVNTTKPFFFGISVCISTEEGWTAHVCSIFIQCTFLSVVVTRRLRIEISCTYFLLSSQVNVTPLISPLGARSTLTRHTCCKIKWPVIISLVVHSTVRKLITNNWRKQIDPFYYNCYTLHSKWSWRGFK